MKNTWPISFKKKINSSIEDLWKIITKPNHLDLVHPFCKSNEVIKWNGKDSKDVLIYLNGLTFFRNFIEWNEKKGYTLLIGRKRGKKSKVVWEITNSKDSTFLKITVYPYLLNSIPKFLSYLPYKIFIGPILKNYLQSVVCGIDWYLTNKKKIPRNYFGKHIWFSKF